MSKHFKMSPWRERLHEIIYEADTREGKFFDVVLLWMIIGSLLVVILDSVEELNINYATTFFSLEWVFTILFTIEYILRIITIRKPFGYIFSFFGIVDLISILPTYLSLFSPESSLHYLLVLRGLRLLRIFRVLKMLHFLNEGNVILEALQSSRKKISVFLFFILILVVIMGALMYVIERDSNAGFNNIPRAIYWAIVTLTTVGYGDISPITPLGQIVASIIMIMGYGVIAVPTGIVTSELTRSNHKPQSTQACRSCSKEGHAQDAKYCKYCGAIL